MSRNLIKALAVLMLLTAASPAVIAELQNEAQAPDFTLNTIDGVSFNLYNSLKSHKVLLLDFWATWCGPCRTEIPFLVQLFNKYKDQGLAMVGVAGDENMQDVAAYVGSNNIPYVIPFDAGFRQTGTAYGIEAIPTTYILDPQGIVRYVGVGFAESEIAKMEAVIQGLIAAGGGGTDPGQGQSSITITSPTSGAEYSTGNAALTIGGITTGPVQSVRWSNNRGGQGTAAGTASWIAANIPLQSGVNTITVSAVGSSGVAAQDAIRVTYQPYDTRPPTVAVTAPTLSPSYATSVPSVSVSGGAWDDTGVAQVTWSNDRGGGGVCAGTTAWSAAGIALLTGSNLLTFTARDSSGNRAFTSLTVQYTPAQDAAAPSIAITSPTSEGTCISPAPSLDIAGSASSPTGIAQVSWVNASGGSGVCSGLQSWSATVSLSAGTNVVTVTATGSNGKSSSAVIQAIYSPATTTGPVNVSVVPLRASFVTNQKVAITAYYGHSQGYENLKDCRLIVNDRPGGYLGVYLYYNRSTHRLYLGHDSGQSFVGGFQPGAARTMENSACKVYCGDTTVSASGNVLAVTWVLEFKTAMAGDFTSYMRVVDQAGRIRGWDEMGTVAVNRPPENISLTPASGTLAAGSVLDFTTVYASPFGYSNIADCRLLVNSELKSGGAFLRYDTSSNRLYLRSETTGAWLGGYSPGSTKTIENGFCALHCATTQVSGQGEYLTIRWRVTIKPELARKACSAWMYCGDFSGLGDGWDKMGEFVTPNQRPATAGLTPDSGGFTVGDRVVFEAVYSDPNGHADLADCRMLMNTVIAGSHGVFLLCMPQTNRLYLRNDGNTAWLGGNEPGTSAVIENSYCRLYCDSTTVQAAGNNLTVRWAIDFKDLMLQRSPSFWAWLYCGDAGGLGDGWDAAGSFRLAGQPPIPPPF